METRDRRIIEILIGVVFIVLLLLVVFLVIGISKPRTTITDSYNTYNIYPTQQTQHVSTKPYIVDRGDYAQIYYVPDDFRYADSRDRYSRYYESSRFRKSEGIFGSDIYRYEVYVKNREYAGGYFTVRFYFEDYYGRTRTESITHYISARGEKLFLFKDISPDKYDYRAWWHEVKSLTKAPTRVYYN